MDGNPAPVYFDAKGTDYVPHIIGVFKQYEAVGVKDPTIGYYSESAGRQGEWRSNDGYQVRKEFEGRDRRVGLGFGAWPRRGGRSSSSYRLRAQQHAQPGSGYTQRPPRGRV
jgi:hypothetical protein